MDYRNVLGSGAHGQVIRAAERVSNEVVAVKLCRVMSSEQLDWLRHEAWIMEQLVGHPNILEIKAHGLLTYEVYGIFCELGDEGDVRLMSSRPAESQAWTSLPH